MNEARKYIKHISQELGLDEKQANDYLYNKTSFPFVHSSFDIDLVEKVKKEKELNEAKNNQRSMF